MKMEETSTGATERPGVKEEQHYRRRTAWLIWLAAVTFYCYEFFVRVAPGSMFREMQRNYGVTAGLFCLASGVYYYIYAPIQIIAGALFDRFGGRRVLLPASLCVALGCACVLLPLPSLGLFALGRLLMGLGSGFGFIGVMYLATVWFPRSKLSLISGLTTSLGFLGAILTLQHIPRLVERIGWHSCWLGAGVFGLLLTGLLGIALPRSPHPKTEQPEAPFRKEGESKEGGSFLTGLWQVLKNPQTWVIGGIAGALYATPTVFGDLWGNAYFRSVTQASNESAGQSVAMLYLGWFLGAPFFGWLSDRTRRKKIFLQLATLLCGLLLCLFLYGNTSLNTLRVLLLLIGFFGTPQVACFTASIESNSNHASGSAVAVVNMILMLLGGLTQPLVGWLVDILSSGIGPPTGMAGARELRLALGLLPLLSFLGFLLCFFYDEKSGERHP
ncbi:MAG: MFS transporter [Puniceicoccales bacterium]|nr:MFS transporter [Puniceicoccales bacterium]